MLESTLFTLFGLTTRVSARSVIRVAHPVHAVLCLIASFVSACALMRLLQVEFMALIFIVVYVGAIAVLFLFVVMMLNLGSSSSLSHGDEDGSPRGTGGKTRRLSSVRCGISRSERRLVRSSYGLVGVTHLTQEPYVNWVELMDPMNSLETMGQRLYTHYFLYMLLAGFVLLVARVGAIVLTLKVRTFARSKRQQVHQQRSRDAERAIRMTKRVQGDGHPQPPHLP